MTSPRPALSNNPDWARAARDAVDEFVAELQEGIDTGDARIYNAHFSDDVMWGSPYGATVGFATLHSIHRQMFERGVAVTGPSSRDGHWWLAGGQNTFIRPKP
jgi:hypothetical protein